MERRPERGVEHARAVRADRHEVPQRQAVAESEADGPTAKQGVAGEELKLRLKWVQGLRSVGSGEEQA